MSKGWYQSRNDAMCFYQCEVNVPNTLNQLATYVDVFVKEKTTPLNPIATPCVCEGENINLDIESKKALTDALLTSKSKTEKWAMPKTRKTTKIKNPAIQSNITKK